MINNSKIKTCFGMALMNEMKFKTLGGSDVTVTFKYEIDEGTALWMPVFRIVATVIYYIRNDMQIMHCCEANSTLQEAKNPAEIVKSMQSALMTKIINEVFDKEVHDA